ncbi:hypothetical protein P154DRAFT_577257 [Amniculicola lignicola CBS 123094]|uniref:Uncharacterized protein n=1 Tax=Amniculicola lignicola CBS 123094 TaxID=1392246 RepID=A0A6A5WDY0_9PLEO|nr:hypothetical protein P154DRAFT_577257 [Amniculicola lignicola CBS 123094]
MHALTPILTLLPLTLALPNALPSDPAPGAFFSCIDSLYEGDCKYHSPPPETRLRHCHNFDRGAWNKISSINPDPGAYCWFFTGEECLGDHLELRWPGSSNLRGLRWDNAVRSWKCWAEGTY